MPGIISNGNAVPFKGSMRIANAQEDFNSRMDRLKPQERIEVRAFLNAARQKMKEMPEQDTLELSLGNINETYYPNNYVEQPEKTGVILEYVSGQSELSMNQRVEKFKIKNLDKGLKWIDEHKEKPESKSLFDKLRQIIRR